MIDYTKKAKKLSDYERAAVNKFIERVWDNENHLARNSVGSILLYGSAAHSKRHNDVDLAILVNSDKILTDPFTGRKNERVYQAHTEPYASGPLQEFRERSDVLENKVELDSAKIHYIVVPLDKIINRYYEHLKSIGCETIEGIFLKGLIENSVKLY